MIPNILKGLKFDKNDITISDDVIKYIINKQENGEEGVRQTERSISIIFDRINLLRLVNEHKNNKIPLSYFMKDVRLPFKITKDIVDKMLF